MNAQCFFHHCAFHMDSVIFMKSKEIELFITLQQIIILRTKGLG